MFTRRALLLSGAFASRLRPAEAQQRTSSGPPDGQDLHEIRDAIMALRPSPVPVEVGDIRDKQRNHLKVNQKLPDYIDVGILVWEHLFAWHYAHQIPLKVSRTADGRAEMEVMLTTVVLRPDLADTQIGVPYDR